mgnify:FL=1
MAEKVDLGLGANVRKKVADGLAEVLADHYLLALKTQNFHWNVTGPNFQGLHTLFGTQYAALHLAIDELAERIRTLGFPAPGGFAVYGKLASLKEAKGGESWQEMCAQLAADNDALVKGCRKLGDMADEAGDTETGDLMNGRKEEMAKAAWMLRSHVG